MLSSLLINLPVRVPSGGGDVGRLQTLRALGYFELDTRPFIQATIPFGLNLGEVYEDVLSVLPLDKAVALSCVEPLHCTFFFHLPLVLLLQKCTRPSIQPRKQEMGTAECSHAAHLVKAGNRSGKQDSNALPLYNRRAIQARRRTGLLPISCRHSNSTASASTSGRWTRCASPRARAPI